MKKPSKLKMARIEAGLSQGELAQKCGACRTTIHDAELCVLPKAGDYRSVSGTLPSGDTMVRICRVLGKTLNDLFWEE